MSTPLKPLPTDAKVSYFDLGSALRHIGEQLQNLPQAFIRNVEYEEEEAYQRIERIIVNVNNKMVELEKNLGESEESVIKAMDEHYNRVRSAREVLDSRIKSLPEIPKDLRLPYNIDEMIKVSERLERMTPLQWERLKELASVFAVGEK